MTLTAVRLTLPVPPSANRWWRMGQRRLYTPDGVVKYQAAVRALCLAKRVKKFPQGVPLAVTLVWYRSRKAGDLDKRIGVLLDALQGGLIENDRDITHIEAHRVDGGTPRLELEVRPAWLPATLSAPPRTSEAA